MRDLHATRFWIVDFPNYYTYQRAHLPEASSTEFHAWEAIAPNHYNNYVSKEFPNDSSNR